MRKLLAALTLFLCILFGAAEAEGVGCTLSVPREVCGFQDNVIRLTSPQEGTITLLLTNGLGRECLYIAKDAPLAAGESTIVWDGLGMYEEPLARETYTLTATFAIPDGIFTARQSIKVGASRQAVLFALSSGRTLYQRGGLDWFTEVKLIRQGMLCTAYYRAEDMETPLAVKQKSIKNYRVHNYFWDGTLNGQQLPADDYVLRFYAEESPDIYRDVPVTLVDEAYSAPALTVTNAYLPPENATDAQLWAWLQSPLTVVDLKSSSHQKLYASPSKKSKSLGTIHGQSQGVQILELRTDGWTKVGAYTHEKGAWTEGYVQTDRLMTLPADSDYGLVLNKRTQQLLIFYQGERIATLSVSTGLMEKRHLEQETPAGAFLTLEHMQDFSMEGNNYAYVIRYDGGNLLHQCAYRMRKGWQDFSAQEALLGEKASHGCIRLPFSGLNGQLNAYWLWTHLPYHSKLLILDDPNERWATEKSITGKVPEEAGNVDNSPIIIQDEAQTPPPLTMQETELTLTLGGDVVLGTQEKWQDSPEGLPAYLEKYGMSYPFAHLQELFSNDDMTFVNLECVLKDTAQGKAPDRLYNFRGMTAYTQVLLDASIEQVNLANNHFIDYKMAGRESTRAALDEAGIAHSGFGDLYIWEINGHKIGFGGCREFVYNQDKETIARDIAALKEEGCEVIIYSCHWGTEYEPLHNRAQESMAKAAIAAGADIIIGTHPHVVQGINQIDGAVVLYSLGNLMFGGTHDMTTFDGLLLRLRLRFDALGRYEGAVVEPLPVLTSSSGTLDVNNFAPILAEGDAKERIWQKIQADTPFVLSEEMWFPRK